MAKYIAKYSLSHDWYYITIIYSLRGVSPSTRLHETITSYVISTLFRCKWSSIPSPFPTHNTQPLIQVFGWHFAQELGILRELQIFSLFGDKSVIKFFIFLHVFFLLIPSHLCLHVPPLYLHTPCTSHVFLLVNSEQLNSSFGAQVFTLSSPKAQVSSFEQLFSSVMVVQQKSGLGLLCAPQITSWIHVIFVQNNRTLVWSLKRRHRNVKYATKTQHWNIPWLRYG